MADSVKSFYDIQGWFRWVDFRLFEVILSSQRDLSPATVVELGCYLGKSAVVIGKHVGEDERFVVVDLFGETHGANNAAVDQANLRENQTSYVSLTRGQFEKNYLALHPKLPEVVQGFSSEVVDHVSDSSARFIHVDASHLYNHVRIDAINARRLAAPHAVVAFDDFRSEHTPGVAAAVWESVFDGGLIPFAVTPQKLYGTYDDPTRYIDLVRRTASTDDRLFVEDQEIAGHMVMRIKPRSDAKPAVKPIELSPSTVDLLADALVDRMKSWYDRRDVSSSKAGAQEAAARP